MIRLKSPCSAVCVPSQASTPGVSWGVLGTRLSPSQHSRPGTGTSPEIRGKCQHPAEPRADPPRRAHCHQHPQGKEGLLAPVAASQGKGETEEKHWK